MYKWQVGKLSPSQIHELLPEYGQWGSDRPGIVNYLNTTQEEKSLYEYLHIFLDTILCDIAIDQGYTVC